MTTLVAYATKHGSTREVAEAIAGTLAEGGRAVELCAARDVRAVEPYEGVVLGGALYTGRWHRDARAFLKQHRHALAERPVAVFGMGPRTLAANDVADSRAQLDKALAAVPEVKPLSVAIFGGVVDPTQLRFPFNRMPASDARDWDAIGAWTALVAERLAEVTALAGSS
jgi:menaquinone-dependent protoporphyrinogen oxidase